MRKSLLQLFPDKDTRVTVNEPNLEPPAEPAEMPRVPIRFYFFLFGIFTFLIAGILILFFSNPAGEIRDPRLGTQYNDVPLTSIGAVAHNPSELWIGSMGKGLRVYQVNGHHFDSDLTVAGTGGRILSDYVADLDVSGGENRLGAILAARDDERKITGLQVFDTSTGSPDFWPSPLIDMKVFPGLSDESASCAGATVDGRRLIVGTRGHGVGVYTIANHSWSHVLTEQNGLPSNTVHDLAVLTSNVVSDPSWLYVATDKGIAGGYLSLEGIFEQQVVFNGEDGLAGDDIREFQVSGDGIWYRTAANGFGRIDLAETGAPSGTPPVILVTESRLPGLTDDNLRTAARSPAGPITWFSAEIDGRIHLARYREFPHDLSGTATPAEFAPLTGSVAADWETGNLALFGTEFGVWQAVEDGNSKVSLSFAGPEKLAVHEVALGRRPAKDDESARRAFIKGAAAEGMPFLQQATQPESGPWDWQPIVGTARFADLNSIEDITCATSTRDLLYFGTEGKGIGQWFRPALELRRHGHSGSSAPMTLRDDTSLDLAMAGSTLIQVTGDLAVDTFDNAAGEAISLVPPSSAFLNPGDLQKAVASGPWLVLAERSRLSAYDTRSFQWRDLPAVNGLAEMKLIGSRLWTRSANGDIRHTDLENAEEQWTRVEGNFSILCANRDIAVALTRRAGGSPSSIHLFDGKTGETGVVLKPDSPGTGATFWSFAAASGDSLYLCSSRGIDEYDLVTRRWKAHTFPGEIQSPIVYARQNDEGFWLRTREGRCFQFSPGEENPTYQLVNEDAESLLFSNDAVLATRTDGPGRERAVRIDGTLKSEVVVGSPFQGDLATIRDATEWEGKLFVITASTVGHYDWEHHDWETVSQESVTGLQRLVESGDRLWAIAGNGQKQLLASWDGSAFQPVLNASGEQATFDRVSGGEKSLYQLTPDGKILETTADNPAASAEIFSAPRLPAGTSISPERTAIIGDQFLFANGSNLHAYSRGNNGLTEWKTIEGEGAVKRILQSAKDGLLLEDRDNGIWIRDPESGFHHRIEPPAEGDAARNSAITDEFAALSFQRQGEAGLRLRIADTKGEVVADVIGDPVPNVGNTLRVFETENPDGIIRLSEGGQISRYDTTTRSWTVTIPKSGIRDMQSAGKNGFWAWDVTNKQLQRLDKDGAVVEQALGDQQITRVTFFEKGAVLQYADGGFGRLNLETGEARVVIPPDPNGPLMTLPSLSTATVIPGTEVLALAGEWGRIISYDWATQTWMPSVAEPRIKTFREYDKKLYFVDTSQRVCGPVTVKEGQLDFAVPEFTPRQHLMLSEGSFAIASDGSLYRLNGRWEKVTGDAAPFAGVGTVTERLESGGVEFFLDALDHFAARKGDTWLKWEGQGQLLQFKGKLYSFAEGQLSGPIQPGNETPDSLGAAPIANPADTSFAQAFVADEKLFAQAGDGSWHTFDGTTYLPYEGEAPTPPQPLQPEDIKPLPGLDDFGVEPVMKDWRIADAEKVVIERKFGDTWSHLPLDGYGFLYEKSLAAEMRGDEFWVYTPAGRIIYGDKTAPIGFDTSVKLPDGIGPAPRFLSYGKAPILTNGQASWIWTEEKGWEPAPEEWIASIRQRPLIQSDTWEWKTGETEERVLRKVGGKKLETTFSPTRGRFGWDDVRQVGQAGGRAFAMTSGGVYAIDGKGLAPVPSLTAGDLGSIDGVEFLESTGASPGGLRRGEETIRLFDGKNWQTPDKTPELAEQAKTLRIANGTWQVNRDGDVLRALPQDADTFAPVALLPDGRWNFEAASDIVAAIGKCFLATTAGIVSLDGNKIEAWWPPSGEEPVTGLQRDGAVPVAVLSDGKNLRFNGQDWNAGEETASKPAEVREGKRFRISRDAEGAVSIQVKLQADGEFIPTDPTGGRFAFEDFLSVAPLDGKNIVALTGKKMVEIDEKGDIHPVDLPDNTFLEKASVYTAPSEETGKWETFLNANDKFFTRADTWGIISAVDGARSEDRSKELLVHSSRWDVRKTETSLEFGIHLEDDPDDTYKNFSFDSGERLFDFDRILSLEVAGDEGETIMAGSISGIQSIDLGGKSLSPVRLWRKEGDGVGSGPVLGMVRSLDGNLYARQGEDLYRWDNESGGFERSSNEAMDKDLESLADDPEGWSATARKDYGLDLGWKGQPVALKPLASGKSRFRHNLIHSVAVSDGKLVLGTEGGMVIFGSSEPASLSDFDVISAPFFEAEQNSPLVWAVADDVGESVWMRDEAGRGWKVNPSDLESLEPDTFPNGDDLAVLTAVHKDDALTWHEDAEGVVWINYPEGLAHPATLTPEIKDGTFTFLRLPGVENRHTLATAPQGVFWATEAGIIQYDPAAGKLTKIHHSASDEALTLVGPTQFQHQQEGDLLFAKNDGLEVRFAADTGLWTLLGETDVSAFAAPDFIGRSDLLAWSEDESGHVSVELLGADTKPGPFIGVDGKPLIDEITAFTFVREGKDDRLIAGTAAGVLRYDPEEFSYLDTSFAAFGEPVNQLASLPSTKDRPSALVARSKAGKPFQWTEEGGWADGDEKEVATIINQSYRVHRDTRWDWAQYPDGLTCTLLNTNGPPLPLGGNAIEGLPPIFTGERLAIDHVQSVAVTPEGEILASSPVGILRFTVDPETKQVTEEFIDVWTGGPSNPGPMPLLTRIKSDGKGMIAWNNEVALATTFGTQRVWMPYLREHFKDPDGGKRMLERFAYRSQVDAWRVARAEDGSHLLVNHNNSRKWSLPFQTIDLRDIAATNRGLWILNDNQLYLLDRQRLLTHPLYWFAR